MKLLHSWIGHIPVKHKETEDERSHMCPFWTKISVKKNTIAIVQQKKELFALLWEEIGHNV